MSLAVAGLLATFGTGCSNTSYLTHGEKLYTGAEVNIEQKKDIPDKNDLEKQLDQLVKPEPNGKLLGLLRFKLWLYNIGIFKESMGEPPVLLQSVAPDRVTARMRNLLENKGYFWTDIRYTVHEDEKTADIQYDITIQPPYRIDSITLKGGNSALVEAIRSTMGKTLIVGGDQYDLDKLKKERDRIDAALKEKGYFYFSPDFIVFQADSTAGKRTVDLTMQVKTDIPIEATRIYTISNIYIESGYLLNQDSTVINSGDTINVGGCRYIDLDKKFGPDVIVRSVFFKKKAMFTAGKTIILH